MFGQTRLLFGVAYSVLTNQPMKTLPTTWHVTRVYSRFNPKWAIHQGYTARYLCADDEWGSPVFARLFDSYEEAQAHGNRVLGESLHLTNQ